MENSLDIDTYQALCKFYDIDIFSEDVDHHDALILAMLEHIKRLQARLPQAPEDFFDPSRPRG